MYCQYEQSHYPEASLDAVALEELAEGGCNYASTILNGLRILDLPGSSAAEVEVRNGYIFECRTTEGGGQPSSEA